MVKEELAVNGGKPVINDKISKRLTKRNQTITDKDIEAVVNYLKNEPLSIQSGGVMEEFEQKFAEYIGCRHAVSTHNGTSALMAALFACGIGPGDEVIIPTYAFHGIAIAVLLSGAKVIFCDVDPHTLTIDPLDVERKITESTKAIIGLHVWGNPYNIDMLREICNRYGLILISDASHALGAEFGGKRVGSLEDISIFSLGFSKLINAGELGIAVTNNIDYYDRMLLYGHVNRVPKALYTKKYKKYPNSIGPKIRPHVLALVLALRQLQRYEQKKLLNIKTNRTICEHICDIPGFLPQATLPKSNRVYSRLILIADKDYWTEIKPYLLLKALKAEGLPIIPNEYDPLLDDSKLWEWPSYKNRVIRSLNPQAHSVNPWIVTLPSFLHLSENEIKAIRNAFEKISQNREKLRRLC